MTTSRTIRSRAPMRISFGGGGSEIDPFMSQHGGRVMNSTIAMYAHASVVETSDDQIIVQSSDAGEKYSSSLEQCLSSPLSEIPKACVIAVAVLQFICREMGCKPKSGLKITTYSDAPVGSGLGASSTMTVAIVHCMLEYFFLPSDPYSLASIAHKVERQYLGLAGGIQDHFCAAFGGFNFMEFGPGDHVLINPLRIKRETLFELESSLVLVYTGTSRDSSLIIENQISGMLEGPDTLSNVLHEIAKNAELIKSSILKWNLSEFAFLLTEGWELKKTMSGSISNPEIDSLVQICINSGGLGSKLCGAGGGGYLLVAIRPENRRTMISGLGRHTDDILRVTFVEHGSEVWTSAII